MRAVTGSAVLMVLVAGLADAQVCAGTPSFASGAYRVGGIAMFTEGAQEFGGTVGVGSSTVFGGITLGGITYDDLDGSSFLVGGTAGYQIPLGTAQTVQLCPVASGSLSFGPNDIEGTGVDASSQSFSFGGVIGGAVSTSPQLQVIPTGGLAFAWTRVELEDDVDSISESDTYGLASVGVGFVLSNIFTIQPNVIFPFGLDENDPMYGVVFTLNFGRRQ